MRIPPADLPRRPLGLRGWVIGAAVVVVVLLLSARGLASVYTDYLWFDAVGFGDTWRRLLSARALPAFVFSAIFFVFLLVNLIVADRVAPRYRSTGPEDEIIERYRTYVAPYAGRLRMLVALFFALVMGGGVSAQWQEWVLFTHAADFGVEDEQFGRDVGFYVFRLPFLQFAASWLFAALLVVLIVVAVFHYLNGGIRLQSPWQRVTPQVKVHLSVILALMALTKTAQYYLARFELAFSHRGVVDGATYTDVKAQLPALNLLMLISVAAAALFIANIFRRGWVFPIIAVGLWGFISLVVGTIYPAVIQRFVVQPNEFSREAEYIERNIEATRTAFGLDDIDVREFDYGEGLSTDDVAENQATLGNIRLWDPDQLGTIFRGTQAGGVSFYRFNDVDVDRYEIGSDVLQTFISPRELDPGNIPDRTWTNRHLVYTHGYAAVASAANTVDEGEPSYLLRDTPPTGELARALEEPRIYFGENLDGYVVVDTKVREQQAAEVEGDAGNYRGDAGVATSSFLRRLAFAARFWDGNLIFSGQITDDSRVLYFRDIKDRIETAAPFLRYDADPYPVLADGRIVWVLDAYTTSDRYPYSQSLRPRNLPSESGLATDFNYIRNSVKATVDAYDGTVRFYVVDETDPIARAYRNAFPELFDDVEDMPAGLRNHWRYPEDLFRAQTEQYTLYHMTDPQEFFQKRALWDVAPDPKSAGAAAAAAGVTTTVRGNDGGRNTTLAAQGTPIAPQYVKLRLPGEDAAEFVLTRPFVPRRKPNQLSGFLYARSDPEHYGELVLYEIPDEVVAPSPARAATLIETEPRISEQFTLVDRSGSAVERGQMQLVPVGDSIMYFLPVYVDPEGEGTFPRLRFLAVAYGEDAVLADFERGAGASSTIADAVTAVVTGNVPAEPVDPEEPTDPEEPGEPAEPLPTDVAELLARAVAEFAAADEAFAAGDLGAYQDHVEEARRLVDEADRLAAQGAAPVPTTTTTAVPARL